MCGRWFPVAVGRPHSRPLSGAAVAAVGQDDVEEEGHVVQQAREDFEPQGAWGRAVGVGRAGVAEGGDELRGEEERGPVGGDARRQVGGGARHVGEREQPARHVSVGEGEDDGGEEEDGVQPVLEGRAPVCSERAEQEGVGVEREGGEEEDERRGEDGGGLEGAPLLERVGGAEGAEQPRLGEEAEGYGGEEGVGDGGLRKVVHGAGHRPADAVGAEEAARVPAVDAADPRRDGGDGGGGEKKGRERGECLFAVHSSSGSRLSMSRMRSSRAFVTRRVALTVPFSVLKRRLTRSFWRFSSDFTPNGMPLSCVIISLV